MATIRTAIQITDGMSPAFKAMNNAMNIVLNSFEAIQSASSNAIDTNSIQAARQELAKAETAFDGVEREIKEADTAQKQFTEDIRNGSSAASDLKSKIMGVAAAIGAVIGVKKIFDLSDTLTLTTARLNMMNDGLQTTAELQQKIFQSAERSRASYQSTADMVAKLGMQAKDAFSSNDELIHFSEMLNKSFAIAGADAQAIDSVMYNLTQALASGVLRGQDLNAVFSNAPNVIQNIADYLDVPIGKIREMAAAGELSADVVKNAMLAATDNINAQFESMPKTIGQVWTSIKNRALMEFQPILDRISEIVNNPEFQVFIDYAIAAIVLLADAALWAFEAIEAVATFIGDNWSWLAPIIHGVVAAFIAYNAVALITNGILAVQGFMSKVSAAAKMMETGATFAATAAQYGLNAALYACPLTWIIILIIAVIALFYAAVAAVNHFAGTSVSATGIICGAFMVALAFIGNIFIALWNLVVDVFVLIYNLVAEVANFIGNVFTDPIGAVCRLFFALADTVLGILQALASAIDAIFGSNLSGAVQGWRDSLGGWVDSTFGKGDEIMAKMDADSMKLGRFEYGAAWDMGYQFGEGVEDTLGGLFDLDNILGGASDSLSAYDMANNLDGIYGNTGDTAGNTAAMADSMEMSGEDLKYLRDIAEREAINRFTTAEITVEMTNNNNINSDMDLDGVVSYLEDKVYETMEVAAEGVHE